MADKPLPRINSGQNKYSPDQTEYYFPEPFAGVLDSADDWYADSDWYQEYGANIQTAVDVISIIGLFFGGGRGAPVPRYLAGGSGADPRHSGLADRQLCGHVFLRLLAQQPVADGADRRCRPGGG